MDRDKSWFHRTVEACEVGWSLSRRFPTHPNLGAEYQQEPSLTDIRAVRDDPDLDHPDYEGEYVIASEQVYRIPKQGPVESVGDTRGVLLITGSENHRA